jgi:hypothetical protein
MYNKIMEELGLIDCRVHGYSDVLLPSVRGNEVSESLKTLILKIHINEILNHVKPIILCKPALD